MEGVVYVSQTQYPSESLFFVQMKNKVPFLPKVYDVGMDLFLPFKFVSEGKLIFFN